VEAQPSETVSGTAAIADGDLGSGDVSQFAERHRSRVGEWDRVLRRLTLEHRRIALWGAGAKGAMFLNAYRHVPGLEYIVDVNPYKWGLHVPGTGQEVVSPAFLKDYRPDVLLIMNSRYREEIGRQVSDLGLTPELIAI
jgi:hypothetical protein